MPQYNRPPKKKKKGPDEFVTFFQKLVRYFSAHQGALIIVVLAAVVAFGVYGIYLYRQNVQVKKFATLYDQGVNAPPEKALEVWEEIEENDPPLQLQEVVAIQIGGIFSSRDQWEKAAVQFERASDSSSKILKYLGQLARAVSLENAKKLDEALAEYKKISNDKENPLKDYGRLGMARIFAIQGKSGEAEAILFQLASNDSEAPKAVKGAALNQLLAMKVRATQDQTEENKTE